MRLYDVLKPLANRDGLFGLRCDRPTRHWPQKKRCEHSLAHRIQAEPSACAPP
jgi:hypothetical protein